MEGYYDASRRHIAVIILKLGSSPVSEAAPSPYRIIATSCCYCSCQRRTDRLRRTVNWNGDDQSDLAFPVGKLARQANARQRHRWIAIIYAVIIFLSTCSSVSGSRARANGGCSRPMGDRPVVPGIGTVGSQSLDGSLYPGG